MTDDNQSADVAIVDVFAELGRMAIALVIKTLPAVIAFIIIGALLLVVASMAMLISQYTPGLAVIYKLIVSNIPTIVWSVLTVLVKVFVIFWCVIFLYQIWKEARKRAAKRKEVKEEP